MLHIILGILKVIGIILGVLLLVFLALMLAVVFVPVRYRVRMTKLPEPDGEITEKTAEVLARVSWLLHIFSVTVCANIKGELDIAVRLFGIRLPLFAKRTFRHRKAASPGKTSGPETFSQNAATGENAGEESSQYSKDVSGEYSGYEKSDEDRLYGTDADTRYSECENTSGNSQYISDENEAGDRAAQSDKSVVGTSDDVEANPDTDGTDKSGVNCSASEIDSSGGSCNSGETDSSEESCNADENNDSVKKGRFHFIIQKICDRITGIARAFGRLGRWLAGLPERLLNLADWLLELPDKLSGLAERLLALAEKAADMLRRPGELLELARKLELQILAGDVLEYLKYLALHYKPRQICGHLRFGTGDPALSAQLTGLIYLFLPARADEFTIDTEFNEAVFEIEMTCRGHIRACHLIRVAWRAFRNKKLRRLIRYLRKKKGDL